MVSYGREFARNCHRSRRRRLARRGRRLCRLFNGTRRARELVEDPADQEAIREIRGLRQDGANVARDRRHDADSRISLSPETVRQVLERSKTILVERRGRDQGAVA